MLKEFAVVLVALTVGSVYGPQVYGSYPYLYYPLVLILPFILSLFVPESREKVGGAVFITGCDSGMGEATAIHLSGLGFKVFAGIFLENSAQSLLDKAKAKHGKTANLIPVAIDVTKVETIQKALETVKSKLGGTPLVGLINCAGVAFIGPVEYLPISTFRNQLEVNLLGYVATTQVFLPLLREGTEKGRRGRIIFVGTGGGVPSPSPPLLSAYMASKWAVDAFCQSLRLELKLTHRRIDCCMINPGFTKPTGLYTVGKQFIAKMWDMMVPQAKQEYSKFVDAFVEFGEAQPGTHVDQVAFAMERAMLVTEPRLRYCVGFDSQVSPIVGLLPTKWREWILLKSMFPKVYP